MKRWMVASGLMMVMGMILSACDGNGGGSGGDGGADGGSGGGGGADGGSGGGGAEVQCSGDPVVFPQFDKTCTAAADCALGLHQVDCCGRLTAIGMNKAEAMAFDAAEATCQMQYPACGCPAGPTTAEDGDDTLDGNTILVDCVSGSCMSYIP